MDFGGYGLWALVFVTFAAVVAIAIWQRGAVARAKSAHEHTALTAGRPDQRRSDGADPGTKPH